MDSYITKDDIDYLIRLFESINELTIHSTSSNGDEFTKSIINGISDKLLFFKDYDPESGYQEGSIVTFNRASVVEAIANEDQWDQVISIIKLLRSSIVVEVPVNVDDLSSANPLSERVINNISRMISLVDTDTPTLKYEILKLLIAEIETYIRRQYDEIPTDVDDLLCRLANIRITAHINQQEGYVTRELIEMLNDLIIH